MKYRHHFTEYSEPDAEAMVKRLRQIRRLTSQPSFRTQGCQYWPFMVGDYDCEMIIYEFQGQDFIDIEINLGNEVLIITSTDTSSRAWISQPVSDVAMMKLRLHL